MRCGHDWSGYRNLRRLVWSNYKVFSQFSSCHVRLTCSWTNLGSTAILSLVVHVSRLSLRWDDQHFSFLILLSVRKFSDLRGMLDSACLRVCSSIHLVRSSLDISRLVHVKTLRLRHQQNWEWIDTVIVLLSDLLLRGVVWNIPHKFLVLRGGPRLSLLLWSVTRRCRLLSLDVLLSTLDEGLGRDCCQWASSAYKLVYITACGFKCLLSGHGVLVEVLASVSAENASSCCLWLLVGILTRNASNIWRLFCVAVRWSLLGLDLTGIVSKQVSSRLHHLHPHLKVLTSCCFDVISVNALGNDDRRNLRDGRVLRDSNGTSLSLLERGLLGVHFTFLGSRIRLVLIFHSGVFLGVLSLHLSGYNHWDILSVRILLLWVHQIVLLWLLQAIQVSISHRADPVARWIVLFAISGLTVGHASQGHQADLLFSVAGNNTISRGSERWCMGVLYL